MRHEGQDPPLIVVMGVSGAGKSTIGDLIARQLQVPFADADSLHPPANVQKMAAGIPLTDEDRWPWLALVGDALARAGADGTGLVVACSALKRSYRDAIVARASHVVFLHLRGTRDTLAERLGGRAGHFMPATLLDSQLASLEDLSADELGVVVDVSSGLNAVADDAVARIRALQ